MSSRAVLYNQQQKSWQSYTDPVEVIEARTLDEVFPALARLEDRVESDGLHAAGFISYEASAAFDEAFTTRPPSDFPLLLFWLFAHPERVELPQPASPVSPLAWQPAVSGTDFSKRVESVRAAIARGETYQVNLTFPMTATSSHEPWDFFLELVQGQAPDCCGFLQTGRWAICSASPELFFSRDGDHLTMRPMKGTAPRGKTLAEDKQISEALQASAKNRAENIMILDMVRNDLGRIAPPGKVRTESICSLEKHPTVWQLTSTATAHSQASLPDVFRALFPCASITGAPKARTMQIIANTEEAPRDLYTGTFGWLAPGRKAQFSVAIRTALIDRHTGRATYGVGAGITWDSIGAEEYRECLDKAAVLFAPQADFALIETLRWAPRHGYFIFDEHISRLQASAEYFEFAFNENEVRRYLVKFAEALPKSPQRVRLLLHRDGHMEAGFRSLNKSESDTIKVCFSVQPVSKERISLYHKTTQRKLYEDNLADAVGCEEVILWNEQGEVTEGCTTNLVIERNGKLVTPALSCGLLPGTYRAYLLKKGIIEEGIISKEEFANCSRIYVLNALRKWRRAVIV